MKEAKVEYPKIEYDEAMVAYKKLHPKIQEAVSKTDFFIGYTPLWNPTAPNQRRFGNYVLNVMAMVI